MTKQQAIDLLNKMEKGDNEELHSRADSILVAYLLTNGGEDVAVAWDNAAERVGFWYA